MIELTFLMACDWRGCSRTTTDRDARGWEEWTPGGFPAETSGDPRVQLCPRHRLRSPARLGQGEEVTP
jgi:hypothetical protein